MRTILVCCVPENGDDANKRLADSLQSALRCGATVFPRGPSEVREPARTITGRAATRAAVLAALADAAEYLATGENRRVLFYYNGHGDQTPDRSGDEADGRDELWRVRGGTVVDDEIAAILTRRPTAPTNMFVLVSDSCSSGSMIDRVTGTNWVAIGSCQDPQDSLATSDGGVFTQFALLPFLRQRAGRPFTANELCDAARQRISIGTQALTLTTAPGRDHLADWDIV